ncbi:MAG TPA: DUF4330 family protein [Vicinamibacterales bacterium]|nr:DUF4330 family protein [Vicinamibacterales bacterium]
MTLIDDRGRLFGRINLVDAGVALLGVAAAAGLLVAYQVFRLPRGPEVVSVQPATQAAVNGARITLRGRDFLPFLRVFVRRSGGTAGMVHENDNPYDAFTLVNQTQAPWVVESPLVAEVRLPDGMGAGTYDLAFSNETRQLSIARAAFTLTSPPPPPTLRPATAIVRLEGAFTRLTGADAQRLTSGAHLVSDRADESIEILAAAPSQPDVVQLDAGRGAVPAAVDARVRVPATLRVRCTVAGTKCLLGGATITAAGALRMRLGAQEIGFIVDEVAPGFSDAVAEADVTVRFLLRPEEAAQMKTGDLDAASASAADRGPRTSAVLASIASRGAVTRRTLETVDTKPRWVEEPAVRVDAVLHVPVTRLDGVWFYKGQALKSGGTMAFETPIYKARAWVLNVAARAPAKGRSQSAS